MIRPFYGEDLAQILTSIIMAQLANNSKQGDFLKGFLAGLVCLGLAIGLKPSQFIPKEYHDLINGH